jgi:DNA-binding NtrC family response regulator
VLIEDLFYRLGDNGVAIAPLGERRADAVALAYYYLELRRAPLDPGTSGPRRFAWPAIERLLAFDWPGNARQVANAVAYAWPRAAAVRAQLIEVAHLAPYLQALHDARVRIRAEDLAVVAQWAREYAGDRREAAVLLDRHPNTYDKYVRRGVATVASHDS